MLDFEAARTLVNLVGNRDSELDPALERAMAYAGDSKTISLSEIEAVTVQTRETNIFELTDAIGTRDVQAALQVLARLFSDGGRIDESDLGQGMRITGMLLWQMRRLFTIRSASNPGQALNLKPYALQKLQRQAAGYSVETLRVAYAGLQRLDGEFKGGSKIAYLSPYLALQRWILDTCQAMPGTQSR